MMSEKQFGNTKLVGVTLCSEVAGELMVDSIDSEPKNEDNMPTIRNTSSKTNQFVPDANGFDGETLNRNNPILEIMRLQRAALEEQQPPDEVRRRLERFMIDERGLSKQQADEIIATIQEMSSIDSMSVSGPVVQVTYTLPTIQTGPNGSPPSSASKTRPGSKSLRPGQSDPNAKPAKKKISPPSKDMPRESPPVESVTPSTPEHTDEPVPVAKPRGSKSSKQLSSSQSSQSSSSSSDSSDGYLTEIVLKFTTLSDGNEKTAFAVTSAGANVGRNKSNGVSVPSDARMADSTHARIEYANGCFYLVDGGFEYGCAVRLGSGAVKRHWLLERDSAFSVGNSIFLCSNIVDNGSDMVLTLQATAGPLKNEVREITEVGASLGRSSDNSIAVPDRELSRKHSKVEFDPTCREFFVSDLGSTNGTYVQLCGPNGGKRKLSLSDHILVGRTGFSINRFDYGISEEMGFRRSMEDACVVIQNLNILSLAKQGLSPQTMYGVYDGHGGSNASLYLSQALHIAIADGLNKVSAQLNHAIGDLASLRRLQRRRAALANKSTQDADCDDLHTSDDAVSSQARLPDDLDVIFDIESTNEFPDIRSRIGMNGVYEAPLIHDDVTRVVPVSDQVRHAKHTMDVIVRDSLTSCFMATDDTFIATSEFAQSGSTATVALILGKRLYCANVGDSRTMICRNFKPLYMSNDHKPSREDEQERIKRAGGFVIHNRVMGELAVSRAFGDCEFKKGLKSILEVSMLNKEDDSKSDWDKPLITAEPEIRATTLCDNDQFLLLACDGLFDVFTAEEVIVIVKQEMINHGDTQRAAQVLTNKAINERHSRDNVTVVLVILNRWW